MKLSVCRMLSLFSMVLPAFAGDIQTEALPASGLSPEAGTLRDGTYTGSAQGYDGPVQVAVTVAKNRISGVKVISEDESRPRNALQEIPAGIVKRQKADVDGISGATYTSRAVINATKEALKQAW